MLCHFSSTDQVRPAHRHQPAAWEQATGAMAAPPTRVHLSPAHSRRVYVVAAPRQHLNSHHPCLYKIVLSHMESAEHNNAVKAAGVTAGETATKKAAGISPEEAATGRSTEKANANADADAHADAKATLSTAAAVKCAHLFFTRTHHTSLQSCVCVPRTCATTTPASDCLSPPPCSIFF